MNGRPRWTRVAAAAAAFPDDRCEAACICSFSGASSVRLSFHRWKTGCSPRSLRRERRRPPMASVKALLPPSVVEGSPPPAGPRIPAPPRPLLGVQHQRKRSCAVSPARNKATDRLSAAFLFDSRFVVGRGARGVGRILCAISERTTPAAGTSAFFTSNCKKNRPTQLFVPAVSLICSES